MSILAYYFEALRLSYRGQLHYEYDTLQAKHYVIPGIIDKKVGDDSQSLATFYNVLSADYAAPDSDFGYHFEAAASLKLSKDEYATPYYLRQYDIKSPNDLLVSMASIDYYADTFSLSAGRNSVEMEWLQGSTDGFIFFAQGRNTSVRIFWIYNFYDLQPNYFVRYDAIADGRGLYGIYAEARLADLPLNTTGYAYTAPDHFDIYGAALSLNGPKSVTLNLAGSAAEHHQESTGFEQYWRLWAVWEPYDRHTLACGASQTGSNWLLVMLQFGAHPFTPFYRNNDIDRPRAANAYARYGYTEKRWYVDLLYGKTQYTASQFTNSGIEAVTLSSVEADAYIGFALSERIGLRIAWMYLDADSRDYTELDEQLIMADLTVNWP
ncbi:MAG TPA: hypothetical protein ENL04_02870 [Sulfuricurvum sp.]|nr:hypothetical protein [Sulfuricurvum sp.]